MTLPYDYARCRGHMTETQFGRIFRAQCYVCQRRTSPSDHPMQPHMAPPQFKNGECPERIGEE